MKQIILPIILTVISAGAFTGCASQPDFGDRVSSVSKDWKKGEAQVKSGEDRIKKARSDLKSAEKDLARAQSDIERWEARLRVDREAYRGAVEMTGTANEADEAVAESEALKRLSRLVDKSEGELEDARRRAQKAKRKIADAKAKRKKGEGMVKAGEERMKKAERDYKKVVK